MHIFAQKNSESLVKPESSKSSVTPKNSKNLRNHRKSQNRMKKFKKILLAAITVIAAVIYFAEELGILMQEIQEEKKETVANFSQLQDEFEDKASEIAKQASSKAKQAKTKAKQASSKAKEATSKAKSKVTEAAKKAETKAKKNTETAPVGLEIPAMEKKQPSQILEYTGHTLSYNNKTRLPNWVAYELTRKEAQGNNPRKDKFAQDPEAKGAQGDKEDYRNSGWDRGHMAPAGDMKWNTQAMDETYYFTNICPQNPQLNSGDWKDLEEQCRTWAEKYGSVYIVCGPIITTNTHGKLGKNQIVIPDKFFKVLLTRKNGEYQGVGFIYDNPEIRSSRLSTKPGPNRPLESYAVTINQVEAATGLNFFHLLPDETEARVEQQTALL